MGYVNESMSIHWQSPDGPLMVHKTVELHFGGNIIYLMSPQTISGPSVDAQKWGGSLGGMIYYSKAITWADLLPGGH